MNRNPISTQLSTTFLTSWTLNSSKTSRDFSAPPQKDLRFSPCCTTFHWIYSFLINITCILCSDKCRCIQKEGPEQCHCYIFFILPVGQFASKSTMTASSHMDTLASLRCHKKNKMAPRTGICLTTVSLNSPVNKIGHVPVIIHQQLICMIPTPPHPTKLDVSFGDIRGS